ncbi:hypothetical protein ACYX79_10810 [Stenotrophomonas rhizophila]
MREESPPDAKEDVSRQKFSSPPATAIFDAIGSIAAIAGLVSFIVVLKGSETSNGTVPHPTWTIACGYLSGYWGAIFVHIILRALRKGRKGVLEIREFIESIWYDDCRWLSVSCALLCLLLSIAALIGPVTANFEKPYFWAALIGAILAGEFTLPLFGAPSQTGRETEDQKPVQGPEEQPDQAQIQDQQEDGEQISEKSPNRHA